MARGTSRDEGVNADPGGQNVSTTPPLGSAQQSSNAWLGITWENVTDGSVGPREGMSMRYGGDRNDGILFKGTSANMPSPVLKQVNAQDSGEKMSWNSMGQYGPGSPNYLAGGYGAREQMTIGGDQNRGKYVGDGVEAIPDTDMTQYFISGKTPVQMPQNQYLAGTDEARGTNTYGSSPGGYGAKNDEAGLYNDPRAKRGLGKNYPRRDAKNQYD